MDARTGSLWHKRNGVSNSSDLTSTSRWTSLREETDQVSDDWLCVVKAQFILKTDDDQYVDLYEALVVARRYYRSEQYVKNRFLLCPVLRGLPILVTFSTDNQPCQYQTGPPRCRGVVRGIAGASSLMP